MNASSAALVFLQFLELSTNVLARKSENLDVRSQATGEESIRTSNFWGSALPEVRVSEGHPMLLYILTNNPKRCIAGGLWGK